MPQEFFYDRTFVMKKGFPKVTKLGAVSPYGECSPFVFNGRVVVGDGFPFCLSGGEFEISILH